jgi:ABC-2 type transport system permease protein
MLSGAYAPIEAIPGAIRPISYLFPLMYFCRAVRAVTLRGAGLLLVWKDLAVLGGFVLVFLYWAVLSFKKRVA